MALGIAPRTGITVPVPGPANTIAAFQDTGPQPQPVAQQVKLIHAGKPGADDHRIKMPVFSRIGRLWPSKCRSITHDCLFSSLAFDK